MGYYDDKIIIKLSSYFNGFIDHLGVSVNKTIIEELSAFDYLEVESYSKHTKEAEDSFEEYFFELYLKTLELQSIIEVTVYYATIIM